MVILVLTTILISIIFFQYFNYSIAKKLNLFDLPNIPRKIHKDKIPLTGGLFFIIIFFLNYIFHYLNSDFFLFKLIYLSLFFLSLFVIGFIDDRNNLQPTTRIIIITMLLIIFLSLDKSFNLNEIKIFIDKIYYYKKTETTLFMTTACILCLIILFNMIDGLDGLAILIFICWYIYQFIFYKFDFNNDLLIFLSSIVFFYYNMKKKVFLGSSGNIIIALYISLESIKIYNTNDNVDFLQILLFFFIPFIDLFRLFFSRLSVTQHPFIGDSNHFHHKIYRISKKFYLPIYVFFIATPCLLLNLFNLNILICFLTSLVLYFLLIIFEKLLTV